MMPTDNERREVARRLRGLNFSMLGRSKREMWDELRRVVGAYDDRPFGGVYTFARLADLIEPSRGSEGKAILCAHCENVSWCGCEPGDREGGCDFEPSVTEGEPPYNLYSLYEVVFRRRPRGKYAIDDDEVDELVDALLDICNAPGHEHIQRKQPSEPKVRCVAEAKVDGEQFEKLAHDAAVELTGIDRDALLAVAETLEDCAGRGSDLTALGCSCLAKRIREALGVTDG